MQILLATTANFAQKGRTVTTHILFSKGKTSFVKTGKIRSKRVTHTYLVNCDKGQTLAVQLTRAPDTLSLLIIGGDKTTPSAPNQAKTPSGPASSPKTEFTR